MVSARIEKWRLYAVTIGKINPIIFYDIITDDTV